MTIQIAVKLPDELVAGLDQLVAEGAFVSRSSAVRHGVAAVLASHQRQMVERLYAEGYARFPDTDEELQQASRLALESINDEPWEKWW